MITKNGTEDFTAAARTMAEEGRIPTPEEWTTIENFLDHVSDGMVIRLKMILGLRGIRLSELELLGNYASSLPLMCRTLSELNDTARSVLAGIEERLGPGGDKLEAARSVVQSVFSEHMLTLMRSLFDQIRDLTTYLPVWRQNIENRRAMMLGRSRG
ncbi:MAG: hypothetical protein ABFS37_16150 [Acidobacteriota bacterium]